MTFDSFKLSDALRASVSAMGFVTPTPIQAQAIPPALEGKDVLGLAQTGTGKTAAFGLPMIERLSKGTHRSPRALIVAPTRELCEQIHEVIKALSAKTRLRSVTLYGGVSGGVQAQQLRAGVDIAIACPGRLLDHLERNTVDLSHVEVLVLDEADRMFDMGFLPDIRRILSYLPAKRQSMFFSATMPNEIRKLAREMLSNPVTIEVEHTRPLETVSHALYPVPDHLKTAMLDRLLKDVGPGSILVFTRTKHRAKRLAEKLEQSGYQTTSLQGNLSQNRRKEAMDGFRSGTYQIMIATDIASRGLDISTVSHVINFDIPDTVEAYTHRVGRTGRASRTGDAFTLVTSADEEMVRCIERVFSDKLERRRLDDFDYTAQAPARSTSGRQPRQYGRGSSSAGASDSSYAPGRSGGSTGSSFRGRGYSRGGQGGGRGRSSGR